MNTRRYFLGLLLLLMAQTACTTSVLEDDIFTDSDIDVFRGNTIDLMNQYSDDLYSVPFDLQSLDYAILESEPTQHSFKIEVNYGGGEGGCPESLFVLQWDGEVIEPEEGATQLNFGLARFIGSESSCEALVTETLEYELRDLVGDQIDELDNITFRVTSLFDSTTIEGDF